MVERLSSVVYLQNNVSPAHNKTNDRYTSLKPKGIKQEALLSKLQQYGNIYISNK
jgi:hypothetical protein